MGETKTYTCLIIDDEALARKLLAEYAKKIPGVEVMEAFDNAIEAKSFLRNIPVDILFLDINMPDLSGIELVKLLTVPRPEVILTTANDSFAIEGYQLGITDYLLKPIRFERFFAAAEKAMRAVDAKAALPAAVYNENFNIENDYLFCKMNNRLVKIFFSEILFIEAALEYVKIVTETDTFLIYISLHKMEGYYCKRAFPGYTAVLL